MNTFLRLAGTFFRTAWQNRTKIIGYAQVVLGSLAVADPVLVNFVFGQNGMRWVLLSSGTLTAMVGHYNSRGTKPSVEAGS